VPDQIGLAWQWQLLTTAEADQVRSVFLFVEQGSRVQVALLAEGLPADWTPPVEVVPARIAAPSEPVSINVAADRLDEQLDLVGELVMAQAALLQAAHGVVNDRLQGAIEQVARLTTRMRDNAVALRMVSLAGLMQACAARVEQRARGLGRPIRLVVQGGELEIDRSVLDALQQHLPDLVEQLIDLTPPASVTAPQLIGLTVSKEGAELRLRLSDPNGRTALTLTPACQAAISSVRGTGRTEVAAPHGSCLELRFALSAGIIEGLLVVVVADQRFVLPLSAVEEVADLALARAASGTSRDLLHLRGHLVPFVHLDDLFSIVQTPRRATEDHTATGKVVIVQSGGQRFGLAVQQVIGQHQTVIKPLPALYRDHALLAGATILGDGCVSLIIDVPAVLAAAQQELEIAT
jgi:two-component system chemotaxis sensor kinase CheA